MSDSKLARSPAFGVIVSRSPSSRVRAVDGKIANLDNSDPVLVGSTESQKRIVNGLFLSRKRTSEIFRMFKKA